MYRIGIIGYGVVGRGIHKLFKEDVKAIYDPALKQGDLMEANMLNTEVNNKDAFRDLDLVVISVPTNELPDGSADTTIVWETLEWLEPIAQKDTIILIKSTVPPSEITQMHNEYYGIVFSPEYMGESKYYTPPWKYPHPTDMESHTWQIFGGDKDKTSKCVDIFSRRMGVDCQFYQTDIKTAALAKYMENSFFAMKVTFCNEFYDISKYYGVNYNELRDLWLLDPRINRNHTLVFPKDRGYGGKCFPKDTKALIADLARDYKPELMIAMDKVNRLMREKNE